MTKFRFKSILVIAGVVLLNISILSSCSLIKQFTDQKEDSETKASLKKSVDNANQIGLQKVDNNQVEEGLRYFEKALEYAKKYNELDDYSKSEVSGDLLSDAYNNLSYANYKLNQYDLSLEYADSAIQIPPNDSVEYSNRGNAYYSLKEYDKALQDYDKAIELSSDNQHAYYGKGSVYYDQGEYEKALEMFETYSNYEFDDMDATVYTVWCQINLGNYDEGLELADKALQLDEDNIDLYEAKGEIIQATENSKEAERYYQSIADQFSDSAEAQILLGEYYYNNSDYDSALELFKNRKEKFADNTEIDSWIILCYTAKGDMKKANAYYQNILEKGNVTVELCNCIGKEYANLSYYMESIKYFDEAIHLNQADKEAYLNKLYALFYGKRYSKCIDFGKKALKIFENEKDILWYIGESYFNLSEYEEAITWYKDLLEIEPDNDEIISYISDTYAMLEDYKKADQYADEALSINRENEVAQNVKTTIKDRQKPSGEQIKEFIKNNYLYYKNGNDTEAKIDQLFEEDNIKNVNISKALEKAKQKGDIFTFCIFDEYYKDYYETYSKNVEYKDYGDMDYIRIYDFNINTDDQVIEILDSIKDTKNRSLTIDLRQNGGGITTSANNILDALLPECVTCTLIYKDGYTYNYYSDASQVKFKKIYILVDGHSASASELLTLGLKTYLGNVTVIGSNTYGKGVGQLVYEDKKRELMLLLVNHYWNVREQNIMDVGIAPDVSIKSDDLSDYLEVIQK